MHPDQRLVSGRDAARDAALPTGPETMVGDPLSSVTFHAASLTLDFAGQKLHVACPVDIVTTGGTVRAGDRGFCDALCACLDARVESVTATRYALVVAFAARHILLAFQEPIADALAYKLVFVNRDGLSRVFR